MLNQQFGQYRIISKLGEGGMANVYLAKKGSLGKQVALKVLKEDFISNREVRKRFLDEPKKMIKLNHPNIVGVHDLINNTDFVAIELDYIEGKTLQTHLRTKGALPDNEIEHLLKQMLDAIGYAHKKGFVHPDIKPSNLMLTENGIIKLTDFGIAKDMDYTGADTTTGIQMGTPKYMSPEQVLSSKSVDYRSDIYSLGVVLWEMVTGRVPYDIDKDSVHETPTKVVKEKLAVTNTKWDVVIQKATQKEAEDRYADVERIVLKEKSPRPEDNNDDTLKQYIQKIGALSDDEIQDLFMQMLKLVGELHEKDIVYGKINPSNFLLSPNGTIKLKDYNLIKDRDDPFITYSKPDEGRQKENLMYLA
jgi:serine/threonine-protein kinase